MFCKKSNRPVPPEENIHTDLSEVDKSLFEFNKQVITISTTILAAQTAYIVYQDIQMVFLSYMSTFFLICASIASLYAYGRVIQKCENAVLFSNIAAFLMVFGIISLFTLKPGKKEEPVGTVLTKTEEYVTQIRGNSASVQFKSLESDGNTYTVTYQTENGLLVVRYSTDTKSVITVTK